MKNFRRFAIAAMLASAGLSTAQAQTVHKAKNLEWAKVGQSVVLADPAPLKDAKIGDKLKLVDARNAKIKGDGTIATAIVKEQNRVKTWVGWTIKVDSISK